MSCPSAPTFEKAQAAVDALDLSSIIAEFLADDGQEMLELPRLTTGQRKQARKLADEHPGLVCESFGFAEERRLHLFKKSTTTQLVACAPKLSSIEVELAIEDDQAETATTASASERSQSSPSLSSSIPDLPAPPQEVHMLNTFVHFGGASSDERAVQSMPHGMFKQCLIIEAAADGSVYDHPPTMQAAVVEEPTLQHGTEIVVDGLVKLPAFNGLRGVVSTLDEASGRYNVLLTSAEGVQQWAKIKSANLRPVAQPVAQHAPPLASADLETAGCSFCLPPTPHWQEESSPAATLVLTALV